MTHRVHTILSILAEDHAPAALRPSILLTIDWPTVAEEAPATGDDAGIACAASGILSGIGGRENLPALTLATLPLLASRLATVAASLTATGDKAMTAHAAALWGVAAALAGQPTIRKNGAAIEEVRNTLGEEVKDHEHLTVMHMARAAVDTIGSLRASVAALAIKAADIVPGVIATGPAEKATLIATALDRIHEYRNNGTAEAFDRGVKIRAALGIMPGADILGALAILRETLFASNGIGIMSAASMQAENLNLARQGRDRALAECTALREQLLGALGLETSLRTTAQLIAEVIESREQARAERDAAMVRRNQMRDELEALRFNPCSTCIKERREAIDTAARIATDRDNLRASLTVMEAEVARLTARSPVGRITGVKITINGTEETVFAAGDEIAIKPRPQPGDAVPWAEVEDGALYAKDWGGCRFVMVARGERSVASGPEDRDIETFLLQHDVLPPAGEKEMILVARDLGSDPEAWCRAMREWTANGNKPTSKAAPKAAEDVRPLRDEFTRSIDLTGAWMCLMTGPLGNNGARWSLETTIGNTNNLRMRWPSGCTTTLKDPR